MALVSVGGSIPSGGLLTASASALLGVADPILSINAYFVEPWSTNYPFLDISKQMSSWDSAGGNIDWMIANSHAGADSWISATTLPSNFFKTLTIAPGNNYHNGKQYRMQWTGAGTMIAPGNSTVNSTGPNEIVFTLDADVSNSNTQVNATSGPITGLTIVESRWAARYDAGERINPEYAAIVADVRQIRFMDWSHTNGSIQDTWASRPIMEQNSYGQDGNGNSVTSTPAVPLELMVMLCNKIKADMWFAFPHAATNAYITNVANYIEANLDPDLVCTFEMSNEVWNFGFTVQSDYFLALGNALWPSAVGVEDPQEIRLSALAYRTVEMVDLVNAEYSDTSRVQHVLNVQLNFVGQGLDTLDAKIWDAYKDDGSSTSVPFVDPNTKITHLAITSYFGFGILTAGNMVTIDAAYPATSDAIIDGFLREPGAAGDGYLSLPWVDSYWTQYNTAAIARGIKMLQYEGGPHMVFNTGSQTQTSRDACDQWAASSLGTQYAIDMITNWSGHSEADGPYMQFQDIGTWSEDGSWTFQEYMDSTPAGYYAQLFTSNAATANWWGGTTNYQHEAI